MGSSIGALVQYLCYGDIRVEPAKSLGRCPVVRAKPRSFVISEFAVRKSRNQISRGVGEPYKYVRRPFAGRDERGDKRKTLDSASA